MVRFFLVIKQYLFVMCCSVIYYVDPRVCNRVMSKVFRYKLSKFLF